MKLARNDKLILISTGCFLIALFVALELLFDLRMKDMKEFVGIIF
jgi:hypothetical protein